MKPPQPPQPPEETSSKALEMMADPRVSAFLRFFNAIATAVTLAAVLGIGATAASWQSEIQRMGWLLDQLTKDVKLGEETNKEQEKRIRDIIIELKVSEQKNKDHGWRINRLENRSGLNR